MARDYDSTVARIAGNLLSGQFSEWASSDIARRRAAVKAAVATARDIIEYTRRTESADARVPSPTTSPIQGDTPQ